MFPITIYSNIGQKMDFMDNKNVWINDFYYKIFNQLQKQADRDMVQCYFNLKTLPKLPTEKENNERKSEIGECSHFSNVANGLYKIDNLFNS